MAREFPKNNSSEITLPTVGRIVLIYGLVDFGIAGDTPRAAAVAFVDPIDSLVINVGVWNTDGSTGPLPGVKHGSLPRHANEPYWDWMPYQKGQAMKAEQLESALHKAMAGAQGGQVTGLRSSPHELSEPYDNELSKTQSSTPSPVDGKR